MKALKLLFILYSFSLQDVHSVKETVKDAPISLRSYPKKYSIQKFPQKLINPGKVLKSRKSEPVFIKKKLSHEEALKKYTVFPKSAKIDIFNAPDSPLFPLDFGIEQKPRTKKTLRRKRSVDNASIIVTPVNSKAPAAETVSDKPAAKNNTSEIEKRPDAGKKSAAKKKSAKVTKKSKKKPKAHIPAKDKKPNAHSPAKNKKPKAHSPAKKRKPVVNKNTGKNKKKRNKVSRKNTTAKAKGNLKNRTAQIHKGKGSAKKPAVHDPKKSKSIQVRKGSRRLIAGRDANAEDYPYMASIQKDGEHWCSGALLNRRLIITTANCFWKSRSVSRLKVRVGSRHVAQGGQLARIQEVMKHPSWSIRTGPDNDIALALLDRLVRFSHGVHGVDLPNRVMHPPFEDAWVTSFGSERRDGVYTQYGLTLQMYHVRLMSHAKCNNITQRYGVAVSNNFICLAQTGRRAPCTRDTGAPAVSDGILWGLASWGLRKLCGTERFPAMFSYVASQSNLDFVINTTKVLMSDIRNNPMLDRLQMASVPTSSPAGSDENAR